MRHRKAGRRLNMDTPQRDAMFRNMVTSLLRHEQIRTTEARAKELRRYAAKVITLGKRAPRLEGLEGEELRIARDKRVHAIRQAASWVNDQEVLHRVFDELAERYAQRPGGYTRVVKMGRRAGDNAPMAIIQLVGEELEEEVDGEELEMATEELDVDSAPEESETDGTPELSGAADVSTEPEEE